MDIVYILGNGSQVNNEELRYSLRSLQAHMVDIGKVYIVGIDPGFLQDIIHVPMDDLHMDRWKNAHDKVMKACSIPELSDRFLLMHDDFFMLEAFDGATFPYYAIKGSGGGISGVTDFRVHCPIVIDKDLYPKIPISGDEPKEFSPRSFYCNFLRLPVTHIEDCILRDGNNISSFDMQILKKPFFSIGNGIMQNPAFIDFLNQLYPEKSRYEV